MIHPCTILIADISGYTGFVSSTALEHSSHIINELLELIVESNELGLTVSEIEGDAVLFYLKGDALSCNALVNQCVASFEQFHERIKIIDRDTVCKCGACTGAVNLGLKFISHFGPLQEIKVASFTKASGLDMIIAHRLLKNDIAGDEYVIVTDAYLRELDEELGCNLTWRRASPMYPDIGDVGIRYALLDEIKNRIPDPPSPDRPIIPNGDDSVELEIEAPLLTIYSKLIDVERKRDWVVGLDAISTETPMARVGQRHTCFFQGMGIDFELMRGEITGSAAIYSETARFQGTPYKHQQTYTLGKLPTGGTSVKFEIKWGDDPVPPDEMKQQFIGGCAASFEVLRTMLETG